MHLQKKGKRTDDYKRCQDYGLYSCIVKEASSVAKLISSTEDTVVQAITSVNTFDDASMWCKDPASRQDRASGVRECDAKARRSKAFFGDEEKILTCRFAT